VVGKFGAGAHDRFELRALGLKGIVGKTGRNDKRMIENDPHPAERISKRSHVFSRQVAKAKACTGTTGAPDDSASFTGPGCSS